MPQHLQTFAVDVLRLTVWLLLLAAIFVPLERLFALRPTKIFRKAVATDLCYYFLSSLLPGLLLTLPLAVVAWSARSVMPGAFLDMMAQLPLWARIPAALVVGEIGFYWGHRWSHEIPLLWRFHAIHHSAEHIDWLVNTRAHPVDMVFTRLCGFVPMYVLGLAGPLGSAGSATAISVVLIGTVWGFFIHSNLRWRFGPLEALISTPAFHHWHHTLEDHKDRNYASMFPWLDRLFGSHYLPKEWPAEYGTDTAVGEGIGRQVLGPLVGRRRSSPPVMTPSG